MCAGLLGRALGASIGGAPKLLALGEPGSEATREAAARAATQEAHRARWAHPPRLATRFSHSRQRAAPTARIFRKDIARSYERSERAKRAPVRFLDVKAGEVAKPQACGRHHASAHGCRHAQGIEVGAASTLCRPRNFYRILDEIIPE